MSPSMLSSEPHPFPIQVLPDPVRAFATECASSIGCDVSFVAFPALVAVASAIGNSRVIELKRSWREPPILWAAVIGESGTTKSPALAMATRPIRELERSLRAELRRNLGGSTAAAEFLDAESALGEKFKPGAKPPSGHLDRRFEPQLLLNDTTTEALLVALRSNPRGLVVVRDELAGWIASFDQYKSGRGGGDAARWLEMFNANSVSDFRKGAESVSVERASVCVVGGMQPAVLSPHFRNDLSQNGLLARFLLTMPPRAPKRWTDDDISEQTESNFREVLRDLLSLRPATETDDAWEPRIVALSPPARRHWRGFVDEHGAASSVLSGAEAAAASKAEGYAARFALVFHMINGTQSKPEDRPAAVTSHEVRAGITLARWCLGEWCRVRMVISFGHGDSKEAQVEAWLRDRGGSATVRDLSGSGPRLFRGETAAARAALEHQVASGVAEVFQAPQQGPGRPKSKTYRIIDRGASPPDGSPDAKTPDTAAEGSVSVAKGGDQDEPRSIVGSEDGASP